ncbi:MAG: alkaline phosphatase D family protein [Myxococcales bacterium]|nr:alkaline phosphatase D family protein [Myxococcales bacterium]
MVVRRLGIAGEAGALGARRYTRREVLGMIAATAVVGCGGSSSSRQRIEEIPIPELSGPPFTLGIASGDPLDDGVILWTRLAPDPLAGGGMPAELAPVTWEVAADRFFTRILRTGVFVARPELGHSVHVDVEGLAPDTWYWYRFRIGEFESAIGRARTLPLPGSAPERLRFAAASCQNWQDGFYTAYPHLAEEDVDFVFFLGDYIYEYGSEGPVRFHGTPEVQTLEDYRNRYALYKSDTGLQAAHAAFPWVVTWDDHEVDNNYAGTHSEDPDVTEEALLARRAAAYQAYYEHMPLRLPAPTGADYRIYRSFTWGDLASFFVLDTRQYRDDQPCNDEVQIGEVCPEGVDYPGTMMGDEQEAWLFDGLRASAALWNVVAQQVVFSDIPIGELGINPDQWQGYPQARRRVHDFVAQSGIENFIVLSGDIHTSGAANLFTVPGDPASGVIGAELIATTQTSILTEDPFVGGLISSFVEGEPGVEFFNASNAGYFRVDVTRDAWRVDFRLTDTRLVPVSDLSTRASVEITAGVPGVKRTA